MRRSPSTRRRGRCAAAAGRGAARGQPAPPGPSQRSACTYTGPTSRHGDSSVNGAHEIRAIRSPGRANRRQQRSGSPSPLAAYGVNGLPNSSSPAARTASSRAGSIACTVRVWWVWVVVVMPPAEPSTGAPCSGGNRTPRRGRRRVRRCRCPCVPAHLDSPRDPTHQPPGRRRSAHRGARPARPGSPGRLRRLRGLGPRRRGLQARLLRALRAAAPRPGVGRHRGQQRPPDPGLQGHGPGLAGLRRLHARVAQGPPRDRPLALLHDRREHLAERPADVPPDRRRLDRAGPQRQPDQHPRAPRRWSPTLPGLPGELELTPRPSRQPPPTTPPWSPRCSPTTPTPRSSSAPSRCCRCCAAPSRFVWMNEHDAVRRPRPAGHPAAGPRPARPRLGRRQRGRRAGHVGASVVREVEPGEMLVIDENGLRSHRFAEPEPKGCVFEYVYLARPDATIAGRSVHQARVEMGRQLAREFPVEADLVIPVPGVRHARRRGVRRGERHPVRPGLRQERLRRPHVHPAQPDPAPARHPAQAQRARAHDPRQADRGRRRLDRPRQHPARPGPDAARGRRRSRSTSGSAARR